MTKMSDKFHRSPHLPDGLDHVVQQMQLSLQLGLIHHVDRLLSGSKRMMREASSEGGL